MSKSDKTEQATPKKRRDARRKGQLGKSQDLIGWFSLLVGMYMLPWTVRRLLTATGDSLTHVRAASRQADGKLATEVLGSTLRGGFMAVLPLMLTMMVCAVVASVGQTGLLLTGKPLKPDFKRLNPVQGFKRLFSVRSVWETVKQLTKMSVVVVITLPRLRRVVEAMVGHGRLPLQPAFQIAADAVLGLIRAIAWTMFVIALADFVYNKIQHRRDLRMTKQEVREEHRNAEGDGMMKGRIRALQRSMSRNRMMSDVAFADVVITNPTHLAVALRYDPTRSRAPRVVAVGAGVVAQRIRERASEAAIPIVEAKPLARALWRACDVGDEIPAVLYEAVAKALAFVRRLDRRFMTLRPVELPPPSQVSVDLLESVPRKRRRR